ncbi:hypothetical protein HYU07_05255 [Candidatus Woesearchaeota archaeon]|nr:hypothetical protein [Candidatus Woesearchaeota archaeon]
MKRNFGRVFGAGISYLILTGAVVLAICSIVAKEMRNGKILKNPVTIEGKVVSSELKGRNLELRIDSSDTPVDFLAYSLSLGFGDGKYKHDIAIIYDLYEKLKKGDQVKAKGFRDPQTNAIYGSDIERLEYVSLIKK